MTVSTTLNKIIYPGTGAQTVFSFSFAFPGGTATQEGANIQVFYTDTLGNITLLTAGPGATQYQITFNPASGTNPTPAGGTVTYNPSGTPIALGTFLTILRTMPLTQPTSLANQGTLYQPVTEAALDYEMMISQQILEVQSRALVVPVSDPTPGVLPAAAARANGVLGFDSNGNPITVLTAPAGTISGAMQPVVSAATLAAGRTAFGLGNIATNNVGLGLASAAGTIIVQDVVFADSSNQSIGTNQHMNVRAATGAITYTLAQTSTLFLGFGFWAYALTAAVTLSINGADKFSGASTGAPLIIPPGSQAFIITDGAGTWYVSMPAPVGLQVPVNLQLNGSVAASALTVALKDRNGNDPSTASPVIAAFRDSTVANGDPIIRAVTSALSITIPNGATLGTVNGQASRIWVALFDNAGSPVIGVYNSLNSTGPSLLPWDETTPISTTAISAGSTSAQVWYTQGGALTTKSFRILGYVESTQPTAGAWTVVPSKIQLFGPGVKKPGDTVQEQSSVVSSSDSISTGAFVALTNNRITLTPQSAADLFRVESYGPLTAPNASGTGQTTSATIQLSLGTTNNVGLFGPAVINSLGLAGAGASQSAQLNPAALVGYSVPNSVSAVTYCVQGKVSGGAATGSYGGGTQIVVREIFI